MYAFPLLHPGTGCKHTVHICTDASSKETCAIENVCGQCSPMKINHDFQMQVMDGVDGTESIEISQIIRSIMQVCVQLNQATS